MLLQPQGALEINSTNFLRLCPSLGAWAGLRAGRGSRSPQTGLPNLPFPLCPAVALCSPRYLSSEYSGRGSTPAFLAWWVSQPLLYLEARSHILLGAQHPAAREGTSLLCPKFCTSTALQHQFPPRCSYRRCHRASRTSDALKIQSQPAQCKATQSRMAVVSHSPAGMQ